METTLSFWALILILLLPFFWTAFLVGFAPEANLHNVKTTDCIIVGVADMNVPKTKTKENVASICRCLAFLNDLNVNMNLSLLEMPDIPRDSCKRGLADEEQSIQQSLWALQQFCDSRYIVNFEVPTGTEQKCSLRTALWIKL